ncbi:MAG: DUF3810 domain-containing protein [Clostridia bacterium]|nr:DUF3810 domain-containing protein [Clostridia bacterium]
MDRKKLHQTLSRYIPTWSAVLLALCAASLVLTAAIHRSPALATALHGTVGAVIRAVLATLTSWIPFSLAEFLLLGSPMLVGLLTILLLRRTRRSMAEGVRTTVAILSVVSLFYTLSVFGNEPGFYVDTVDKTVGIEREDLSPEQLYETAVLLVEDIREDLPAVSYPRGTYSAMTFSYSELNRKLNAAYDTLCDRYGGFDRMHTNTKPVMLSEPWTYTHISGMYTFFTGEANVNVNYPDFIVVSSAAHEMAHQRGINREDEANFVAYLVCSLSDDPYIRYCGNVDVLNEVLGQLYSASPELYAKVAATVPDEVKRENTAYSQFFEKYRETVVSEVSTAVNDAYISSNNQPAGVKSYGLVVDLVAAYLLQNT